MPTARTQPPRGVTLIEAMIAMAVLLVAGLALASMQIATYKAARFGDRMLQADALAADLADSMKLWDYNDGRLSPTGIVTSTSDSLLTWDLGRSSSPLPTPEFSDADLGTDFRGLPNDTDHDGTADFQRYWNVYTVQPSGATSEDGKLVQIFVRWKEPGSGSDFYRQVSTFTFRRNPGSAY